MRTPRIPDRPPDDERGASSAEYALLIAGIAAVLVLVVVLLGGKVRTLFDDTCDKLSSPSAGSCDS